MTILARISREPAALLGLGTAVVGLLVLTSVVTPEVGGGIGILAGALVACLRYFVTPASEVVIGQDSDGGAVAGPALQSVKTGAPVSIDSVLALPSAQTGQASGVGRVGQHRRDEAGYTAGELVLMVLGIIAAIYIVWMIASR